MRKPRIMILEDDTERTQQFRLHLAGRAHPVDVAEDVRRAKMLLSSDVYDMVFLDHDLGGQQMVESGEGTGYELAQWLESGRSKLAHHPALFIVHSLNPGGAWNIINALSTAINAGGIHSTSRVARSPLIWRIKADLVASIEAWARMIGEE